MYLLFKGAELDIPVLYTNNGRLEELSSGNREERSVWSGPWPPRDPREVGETFVPVPHTSQLSRAERLADVLLHSDPGARKRD
jgi:hypothetical protein